ITSVNEVLSAQREQIPTVGPLGRCSQSEQKSRREMVDQPAIRRGGGVVKLIDHDVVELIAREAVQMGLATERLDRCEKDVPASRVHTARISANRRRRSDLPECLDCLTQDLFAMRDEENTFELERLAVKGAQPGFPE